MATTRKQKREERADAVCREVRYQMSTAGGIADNQKLFALLKKWMDVTGKNKYVRP